MYYRLGLARYTLVTTDHGLVLRKSGAQGPRVGNTRVQGGMTQRFNENHREELHDVYESALDEYSDDPEDW